jgi:hypothetical protein
VGALEDAIASHALVGRSRTSRRLAVEQGRRRGWVRREVGRGGTRGGDGEESVRGGACRGDRDGTRRFQSGLEREQNLESGPSKMHRTVELCSPRGHGDHN